MVNRRTFARLGTAATAVALTGGACALYPTFEVRASGGCAGWVNQS